MQIGSITFKLLFVIIIVAVITTTIVLFVGDIWMTRIIDTSQDAVYSEKIDSIMGALKRSDERLKIKQMEQVDIDNLKAAAVRNISKDYYKSEDQAIYPFIIDEKGRVIMHPRLSSGDLSLKESGLVEKIKIPGQGSFDCIYPQQKSWCVFKTFAEWNWIIVYTIPLEIKYRDVRKFRNILVYTMSGITIFVLLLLSLVVSRFTKPIKRLINISSQIAGGNLDQQIDLKGMDEVGSLARSFATMRDAIKKKISELNMEISERKRAEEALRQNRDQFQSLVTNIPGITYRCKLDRDWTMLFMSDNVENLTGYLAKDFINNAVRTYESIIHHEDTRDVTRQINESIKFGKLWEIEYRILHKTGEIRWVYEKGSCILGKNNSVELLDGFVIDINERKIAEEKLNKAQAYISNIINSMPSMLVGVDPRGVITQWNLEAEHVTGLLSKDALGKPFDVAVPRLAVEMEKVRRAIQVREVQIDAKRAYQKNNETHYEDVTVYPLVANGVDGAVIRVDDVTDKVRLEEMMIQSEKMLSVGGLAAGMAHEINNPLAGMMQTADVMANRLGRTPDIPANLKAAQDAGTSMEAIQHFMEARNIPRMIDAINESGRRLASLVANMLSFARMGESSMSFNDLADLFDKTLELAATDYDLKKQYDFKMINIRKEYEPDLPSVPCEGSKIQQVMLNILRNGAQAMQEAGTDKPLFVVRTRLSTNGKMVCMEIEDNGPGMTEEIRKRVFEPFYTTKPVGIGTGLGLSVSYFIITKNHDGEMTVESRQGAGAKFIFRLPLARDGKTMDR